MEIRLKFQDFIALSHQGRNKMSNAIANGTQNWGGFLGEIDAEKQHATFHYAVVLPDCVIFAEISMYFDEKSLLQSKYTVI